MTKIVIMHHSVHDWTNPDMWDRYLRAIETILDDRIVRLDERDPIRRKADTLAGEGSYIGTIPERLSDRQVWGRFDKTKTLLSIDHYRDNRDYFGRWATNHSYISISRSSVAAQIGATGPALFAAGNELLKPFYSSMDISEIANGGRFMNGFNPARELPGVYWLTYFGPAYVDFFGKDRLLQLPEATEDAAGGITLRLSERPSEIRSPRGPEIEEFLGEMSFARHGQTKSERYRVPFISSVTKAIGQYALTIETLRAWDAAGGAPPGTVQPGDT